MKSLVQFLNESQNFLVNKHSSENIKHILHTLFCLNKNKALEYLKSLDKDKYTELVNTLHNYSDNIPELFGDETPEIILNYLDDFAEDKIKALN